MEVNGVFGLNTVSNKQYKFLLSKTGYPEWPELEKNVDGRGYITGGDFPTIPVISTVYRIDFSSETVTTSANTLSEARKNHICVSAGTYDHGYLVGGYTSTSPFTLVSTISRFEYSSETISAPLSGAELAWSRLNSGNTSNTTTFSSQNYGYIVRGNQPNAAYTQGKIEKLDFTNDFSYLTQNKFVTDSPPSWRTSYRSLGTQSRKYGYVLGSGIGPDGSSIVVFDFESDNFYYTSLKLPLVGGANGYPLSGMTENDEYAYYTTVPRPSYLNRLEFDTNSFSTEIATGLYPGGYDTGRGASSPSTGYYIDGVSCTITNLSFSTETVSAFPGSPAFNNYTRDASVLNKRGNLIDNRKNYGYFVGGNILPGARLSTIDRINFSTETVSTQISKLPSEISNSQASVSDINYGYFGGGYLPTGAISTIDRIEFSTETVTTPTSTLSTSKFNMAAASSSSYGYFGGGNTPSQISTIDRIEFSTETVTTPTSTLSSPTGVAQFAAIQSRFYGYYAGGSVAISTIDRIEFSTETVTTPTSTLSPGRRLLAGTSSVSYGYFGGGDTGSTVSTINRFDFNNETISTLPSTLPSKSSLTATSSYYNGYFAGGAEPSVPANYSDINRFDFSNDTTSTLSDTLSSEKRLLSATSKAII